MGTTTAPALVRWFGIMDSDTPDDILGLMTEDFQFSVVFSTGGTTASDFEPPPLRDPNALPDGVAWFEPDESPTHNTTHFSQEPITNVINTGGSPRVSLDC